MMRLFKSFGIVLLLCATGVAHAQMTADPTTWTYEVKKTGVNEYDLIFHVQLKDGWHIFSQKPGDEFLIPPSFVFTDKNIKLVGKVTEKGKLKTEKMEGLDNPVNYYEGAADFVQKVKARPGTTISGDHEYQVCNDRMCLPPKKKTFSFKVNE
jgi:thiol:disulfide interchange protein DsbD